MVQILDNSGVVEDFVVGPVVNLIFQPFSGSLPEVGRVRYISELKITGGNISRNHVVHCTIFIGPHQLVTSHVG